MRCPQLCIGISPRRYTEIGITHTLVARIILQNLINIEAAKGTKCEGSHRPSSSLFMNRSLHPLHSVLTDASVSVMGATAAQLKRSSRRREPPDCLIIVYQCNQYLDLVACYM